MRTVLFAAVGAALSLSVVPAIAHEDREVGALSVVVGWAEEPAFAGSKNAVQIVARRGGSPVTAANLTVVVQFGEQRSDPMELEPAFGRPGEFRAPIIPTRPGRYTFRFSGRIAGQRFNERFTSGEGTFDDVQNPADAEFPASDPTRGELAERTDRLDARVNETASVAGTASDDASAARTLGIVGIVLGVIAIAGVLLVRKSA